MDSNFQFRARRAEVLTGLYRRRPSKVFAFPPKRPAPCTRDRWFESVSLQRRVCKPSVPQRRSLSLLETGDEHSRIGPVKNRDRTAPAAFPPASGDDRTVASGMVELDRHPVGAVHLDAIDRGVDPAGAGVAHDDDAARSDEPAAIAAMMIGRAAKSVRVIFVNRNDGEARWRGLPAASPYWRSSSVSCVCRCGRLRRSKALPLPIAAMRKRL